MKYRTLSSLLSAIDDHLNAEPKSIAEYCDEWRNWRRSLSSTEFAMLLGYGLVEDIKFHGCDATTDYFSDSQGLNTYALKYADVLGTAAKNYPVLFTELFFSTYDNRTFATLLLVAAELAESVALVGNLISNDRFQNLDDSHKLFLQKLIQTWK